MFLFYTLTELRMTSQKETAFERYLALWERRIVRPSIANDRLASLKNHLQLHAIYFALVDLWRQYLHVMQIRDFMHEIARVQKAL